jgi:ElaB/YqjD/DUF883 family membrane-anchored ribosome-binding protein
MMASDQVLSRDLKSLQEELSAAQRERQGTAAAPALQPSSPTEPIRGAEESGEDQGELRDQLGELANTLMTFLEDAEKDISAHPAQSVAIALIAGILVGWLLGRRGGG